MAAYHALYAVQLRGFLLMTDELQYLKLGLNLPHSILPELVAVEGFAAAHRCLTDRAISTQLDRLCTMAQAAAPAGAPDLAEFLANTRQAARSNVVRSPG